jgi:hypothetical protein
MGKLKSEKGKERKGDTITQTIQHKISWEDEHDRWTGKNLEGDGHGIVSDELLFWDSLQGADEHHKNSPRTECIQAKIWLQPIMSSGNYWYTSLLGFLAQDP